MVVEGGDRLAGDRVPDPRAAIAAGGEHPCAVVGEVRVEDEVLVTEHLRLSRGARDRGGERLADPRRRAAAGEQALAGGLDRDHQGLDLSAWLLGQEERRRSALEEERLLSL